MHQANTHRSQNSYTFNPANEAYPYRPFCSVLLPPPARRGETASTVIYVKSDGVVLSALRITVDLEN